MERHLTVIGKVRFYEVRKGYGFADAGGYAGGIYISRHCLEDSAGFNGPPVRNAMIIMRNVFRKPLAQKHTLESGWRADRLVKQEVEWRAGVIAKTQDNTCYVDLLEVGPTSKLQVRVASFIWTECVITPPRDGQLVDVVLDFSPKGLRAVGVRLTR